jgi:hypothetical protein
MIDIQEACIYVGTYAKYNFDYEKFARELFITDYWYEDGHVFRR